MPRHDDDDEEELLLWEHYTPVPFPTKYPKIAFSMFSLLSVNFYIIAALL